MINRRLEPYADIALSVLRIVAAFLFIAHGTQKLFAKPPAPYQMPPLKLMSQFGFAGILETFGGLAMLLGLFTRPGAFLLSGEMAVAYFQVHFPKAFLPILNQGELPVLFCFIWLYFVFAGGGRWSLDRVISRSRSGSPAVE